MISLASASTGPRRPTLICPEVIFNFVAATTIATGLKLHSGAYRLPDRKATRVSDKQFVQHKLCPDKFHAHSSFKLTPSKVGP